MAKAPRVKLTVNAGSSHTQMALWQGATLAAVSRLNNQQTTDWQKALTQFTEGQQIEQAIWASVRTEYAQPIEKALGFLNLKAHRFDHRLKLPFSFEYEEPATIGTDRLANMAAAVTYYGPSSLIIDFGTAVTFNLLLKNSFKGGVIAPGMHAAGRGLLASAPQLPDYQFKVPAPTLGKSTIESLQAGAYLALAGTVKETIKSYKSIYGDILIIATGAFAPSLPFGPLFDIIDKHLTLRGLLAVDECSG